MCHILNETVLLIVLTTKSPFKLKVKIKGQIWRKKKVVLYSTSFPLKTFRLYLAVVISRFVSFLFFGNLFMICQRVNSFTIGRLNSTGKSAFFDFCGIQFSTKFMGNWLPSINVHYSGIRYVFHRICGKLFSIVDELMESLIFHKFPGIQFSSGIWSSISRWIQSKSLRYNWMEIGNPISTIAPSLHFCIKNAFSVLFFSPRALFSFKTRKALSILSSLLTETEVM